ncbi:hypothetical protein, partial [Neisseria mucosa]|uniref:hypothetical protein n=1 Tax=Neisseria mucosa TaxID=488 RepID=UPI0027E1572E
NAKCFILKSVPTTGTLVLHLKSESKDLFHSSPLKSAIRHYLSVSGDGGILDMPKPMIYC